MLKTARSIESKTWPGEGGVGVGVSSKTGCDGSKFDGSRINAVRVDSGKIKDNEVGKNVQKSSKSKNLFKSQKTVGSDFFTSKAKLIFTKLR